MQHIDMVYVYTYLIGKTESAFQSPINLISWCQGRTMDTAHGLPLFTVPNPVIKLNRLNRIR